MSGKLSARIREELVEQFGDHGTEAFLTSVIGTELPLPRQALEEGDYVSERLALLNTAAKALWAKADRENENSHPSNSYATAWFMEHGLSRNLAQVAVQFIRPAWAVNSRKRKGR